ncbi:MAG: 2-(1,2-epoxy,2-dihydrophenyl)acetyl-CoA isomerase [Cyanobacteria bacterium RYN_339]|nr:2-(1,2-epoxy,2-dihydrophenyl)acetyl-CoA isomerase [Cyanobacteria bacterium RYN_339]
MAYETIRWELENGVGTLTFNRPDVYNSFNDAMSDEVLAALKQAAKDPAVRCVVITGAGRAFCAGQDLNSRNVAGFDTELHLGDSVRDRYAPIVRAIRTMDKPVVAAVNGVAAGAGCSIALACDLRLASTKASFVQAFVRIGAAPDTGTSFFLPRLVGLGRAMELLFTGDKLDAETAEKYGLANRVADPDAFPGMVKEFTERLAQGPTKAMALAKKAVNRALACDLEELLDYEAHMQEIAGRSADYREGVSAFTEKRQPVYTGT